MNKINIISPPDKLYNDSTSILLVYPNLNLQLELQKILLNADVSLNVYFYNESKISDENTQWLLDVFSFSSIVIVDIDHVPVHSHVEQLMSYMISKPKTYWLTNYQNTVYNLISNNKVYDLSFLSTIGVIDDKKQ